MRNKTKQMLYFFAIVSLLYLSPVFQNYDKWGDRDWNQLSFFNAVPRKTILEYRQMPLWNPYYCGGNVYLALPHSLSLSPFFVFTLMLGVDLGLKVQLLLYFFTGLLGMYVLCKQLKLSDLASIISSFIFMFSSTFALRVIEGHQSYWSIVFIPWAMLFYLRIQENKINIVYCSLVLLLMLFSGSYTILPFTLLLLFMYAVFESVEKRKIEPVMNLVFVTLIFLLLGSVKILPMLEIMSEHPRKTELNQKLDLNLVYHSILSRDQNHMKFSDITPYWWHEYGTYVGFLPVILFLLCLPFFYKKAWKFVLLTAVFFNLFLGNVKFGLWKLLHMFPVFSSLRLPSRFNIMFLFCFAVTTGFFLNELHKRIKKNCIMKFIFYLFVFIILIDLGTVSYPIINNTFDIEPIKIQPEKEFYQTSVKYDYDNSEYPNFLKNVGNVDCYENLKLDTAVIPKENDWYRGEAYLLHDNGQASIDYFSPNRVIVNINLTDDDVLVLNQNYHKGWKSKTHDVIDTNGLFSTHVNSNETTVEFYYLPTSYVIGLITSMLTVFLLIYYFKKTNS